MPASRILEFEDEDAIMQDQAIAVEGGKACLRHHLTAAAVKGILHPIEVFRRQIIAVETNKRIKKVMRSTVDTSKAERIASILAKERSVTPVVLDGLIVERTVRTVNKINTAKEDETSILRKKLQSMEAKLENAEKKLSSAKNSKGGDKNKPGKSHVAAGRTANSRKNPPGRGTGGRGRGGRGTGGRGRGTGNASEKKKRNPSTSTSSKKGRGTPTPSSN